MYDLTSSRGRSQMLHDIEPDWRRLRRGVEHFGSNVGSNLQTLGSNMERQVAPVWKQVQGQVRSMERSSWAKIGGGLIAMAAVIVAVQMLTRPAPKKEAQAPQRRVSGGKSSRPARTAANGQRRAASSRPTAH